MMQWANLSSISKEGDGGVALNGGGTYGYGGYIAYSDRLETYLVPLALGIIFLLGLIGNGCLICIFCREPSVRSSVPNTFILNLALGDLLVLFCSVPFTATIYTWESWPYGELICKASEFAKDTSVGISVFTLTALSFDRYTAIVRPVQSFASGPRSKTAVVSSLAFIWILSLALATPALISAELEVALVPVERFSNSFMTSGEDDDEEVEDDRKNITICYPFPERFGQDYAKIVVLARFLIHYLIPLIIIGTLYAITAHHLVQSTHTLPGEATVTVSGTERRILASKQGVDGSGAQLPIQSQSRRKVAKTVLSFTVLFAICFLPLHVFFFWFYYNPDALETYNLYWHTLKIVGFCLAYTNSSINPIALYCISTSFRQYFHRLFSTCCRKIDKDGFNTSQQGRSQRILSGPPAIDHSKLQDATFVRGRINSAPGGKLNSDVSEALLNSSSNVSERPRPRCQSYSVTVV